MKTLKQQFTNRKSYAVRPFNSNNCDDLGCMSRSFIDCKLFSILTSVSHGLSAIVDLFVTFLIPDKGPLNRCSLILLTLITYYFIAFLKFRAVIHGN